MPRANRYWVKGGAYHLTHRCHNQNFLLNAPQDRDDYRDLLRFHLSRCEVSLLSYTITSNHVHILVTSDSADGIACLMRKVQGEFAAAFNQRNGRSGAFWSDRYHATMIEDGEHLYACLRYIDLNMIRAGVVAHPREWAWTAWHELTGENVQNRLIDHSALLSRLSVDNPTQFHDFYRRYIEDALVGEAYKQRDPQWSESVAVGSIEFLQQVESQLCTDGRRKNMTREYVESSTWSLREPRPTWPLSVDAKAE